MSDVNISRKALDNLHRQAACVSTPRMCGDNLAIVLCSFFDDGGEEDESGWSETAIQGYEEVMAAIRGNYEPTLAALAARVAELEAALAPFAATLSRYPDPPDLIGLVNDHTGGRLNVLHIDSFTAARAALRGTHPVCVPIGTPKDE